jgi:hypothetical protein
VKQRLVDEEAVLGHLTAAVELLPAMHTLLANTPNLTVAKAKGFLSQNEVRGRQRDYKIDGLLQLGKQPPR